MDKTEHPSLLLEDTGGTFVLHDTVTRQLTALLGERAMREVAFHEIVNFLRLTPYRRRSSSQQGVTFFACTSMLLRRYRERYGV